MSFEWDDKKEQANKIKHKLSFSTAALVFEDKNRIYWYDTAHSVDEDRYITIGRIKKSNIIMVVYTERKEDKIRIISARAAEKNEREAYYRGKNSLY